MKFYIADTHFGHEGIIKLDKRPFRSAGEMNETLINNWNSVVGKGHEVYIIGDMFWKGSNAAEILQRLNGVKYLVKGNHDRISPEISKGVEWIKDYAEIKDGENTVILCHYPILFYKHSYNPNTFMLCGHVHNQTKESADLERFITDMKSSRKEKWENRAQICNVGCMMEWMNYTPKTLDQIRESMGWYE